jgi:group I intron endonuclease
MEYVIYKITNPTGRIYIGKTSNLKTRTTAYKNANCKDQKALYNSIIKYGWDSHILEVIDTANIDTVDEKEKYYISEYKSFNRLYERGLNLTTGGDGSPGRIISEEQRNRIIHHNQTRIVSAETRQRMSLARKDMIISESTRKKMSEVHKGNKYNIGKKHTIETREAMLNTRRQNFLSSKGPIVQIDADGVEVKTWYLLYNEIATEIGVDSSFLRKVVISDGERACKGYTWKHDLNKNIFK